MSSGPPTVRATHRRATECAMSATSRWHATVAVLRHRSGPTLTCRFTRLVSPHRTPVQEWGDGSVPNLQRGRDRGMQLALNLVSTRRTGWFLCDLASATCALTIAITSDAVAQSADSAASETFFREGKR